MHCEDFAMTNSIIKSEPHSFSWAIHSDLHDTGSALPLVSECKWILSWKILVVLRNTDMQGDAAANQEHDHGILLQPLKKKKKKRREELCPMFHCSSIQINNAAQRYLKLSGSFRVPWLNSQSCFAAGCIWQLRAVQQRQVVLRHQAMWWKALSCAAMELQNGDNLGANVSLFGPAALQERGGKAIWLFLLWLQHLEVTAHPAENSSLSWSSCAFSQALPLRCLDANTQLFTWQVLICMNLTKLTQKTG